MWIYWCCLSTVISGFTAVAMKKCSKNDSKQMAVMAIFSYHFIILMISLAVHPEFVWRLNGKDMVSMLPGLITQVIGHLSALASLKYGKVSITSPIRKCNVVVIFLLGILVLKEEFTGLQVLVSIILVVLSILIAKQKDDGTKLEQKQARKAVVFAYGYVIFNGISKIFNKIYVTTFENPLYVMFNYAVVSMIGVFVYCLVTKKWNYLDLRKMNNRKYFVLQSLCDATSSMFTRFAMLDGNVSVISVIETSSIVITILASRVFLKEKISWEKYGMIVGVFLCVFALALM